MYSFHLHDLSIPPITRINESPTAQDWSQVCVVVSPNLLLSNVVLKSWMFLTCSTSMFSSFQLSVLLFGKLKFLTLFKHLVVFNLYSWSLVHLSSWVWVFTYMCVYLTVIYKIWIKFVLSCLHISFYLSSCKITYILYSHHFLLKAIATVSTFLTKLYFLTLLRHLICGHFSQFSIIPYWNVFSIYLLSFYCFKHHN